MPLPPSNMIPKSQWKPCNTSGWKKQQGALLSYISPAGPLAPGSSFSQMKMLLHQFAVTLCCAVHAVLAPLGDFPVHMARVSELSIFKSAHRQASVQGTFAW